MNKTCVCGHLERWHDNEAGSCDVAGCSCEIFTEIEAEVPCRFCGTPTSMLATRLCNNCWEVEHRLDQFLESEKAREFIKLKLAELVSAE